MTTLIEPDGADQVWILKIEHRHGEDISIHRTEEGAKARLHEYVEDWWQYEDDRTGRFDGEPTPDDPQEAIEAYFEVMGEHDEGAEILPAPLED